LGKAAAAAVRTAIRLGGGREICFACSVDGAGIIQTARVAARGDSRSVLALPGFASRGELLVHNHPSGDLEPSDADLQVAARLHDDGIGFAIVNNEASELYVVVEVPRASSETRIDATAIGEDLGPEGRVATALDRYENRDGQRDMAAAIARLYNLGGIGLLEAGTGVGKSLAYLVPALRWAAANGDRTVVSTNTINLQEQLIGKDLPFLRRALDDQPVRFAMLKGWRNYVCLLRLEQANATGSTLFDAGHRAELQSLVDWSEQTKDGSLGDLPSAPRPEVWDEVAAESDLCLRLKCPHFDECFVFAARRTAAQADVIVVNHHLLMADIAVRRISQNWEEAAVLPAYDRLIIDEGHHLEDAAAKHLGGTITRRMLQRLFNRLERHGKGLLPTLGSRLAGKNDLYSTASMDLLNARLFPAAGAVRAKAELIFDLLEALLAREGVRTLRLTHDFDAHPIWVGGLRVALEDVVGEIAFLREGLRLVRERLEASEHPDDSLLVVLNEMRGVSRRLEAAGDTLRQALAPAVDSAPAVRWLETKGMDRNVAVSSVPLDLAPILREDLFKRLTTAVVTSATLATDGNFSFLSSRLGLDEPEVEPMTAVYPSPFDYATQAVVAIPADLPAPNENADAHFSGVTAIVKDLAEASGGGMFVLFTSHTDVRRMADAMRSRGLDRRYSLLVHGDDSRDVILQRFREAGNAILLGTASFWEGVDVPGRALRVLLIARLPFRVPTEPITAAHCEAIDARGGDSFSEYMLPHASLRLKQGFGRLIRTATDRGVVVLCDPRLVRRQYGRFLLDSLPPARRLVAPWAQLRDQITAFFAPVDVNSSDTKNRSSGF